MIKFKKRESTENVRLAFREGKDATLKDIEKQARRAGKLNLGYHYILHKNGMVDKGIDYDLYADYELAHHKTAIYVLVIGAQLNDVQKHALKGLLHTLKLELKED